ncbi:MAG: DUF1499 domain-containing protein [Pseudohongiellaceae bacterium]
MRLFISHKPALYLLLACLVSLLAACAGERPTTLGVQQGGRLAPCPESPNCVTSFASGGHHAIAPLAADLDAITQVLLQLDKANIISTEENYLYAEFTTRLMGFVDDVEFLFDPVEHLTHVRSASRVGYSDLGANRDRIEEIRAALTVR